MSHILKTISALSFLFSIQALAGEVTKFDCTTDKVIEGDQQTRILFSVENLGKKKVTYGGEDDEDPVKMEPEDSILDLNENAGILHMKSKKTKKLGDLKMTSDGDGCQFTTFVLYKDKNYERGYVRVDGSKSGCGAKDVYSTVSCEVE